MTIESRSVSHWLISAAIVLGALILGRPLLVPLVFAILLWSVLNSLTEAFRRLGAPSWLAWIGSTIAIAGGLYLVARILTGELTALIGERQVYAAKLQGIISHWLAILHLRPSLNISDLVDRSDAAKILAGTASSAGNLFFALILVVLYVVFLLSEQRYLPAKLALIIEDEASRQRGREVIQQVTTRLQAYLGVCTLLSAVMAATTYIVLRSLGIDFAGFWALFMFVMAYIPTIGGIGVILPAGMAYVQSGSIETFLIVGIVLSAVHLILANVVQTLMLGRSLNLSSLAIILSLSFWGLIWGIAGLFLAVPILAATAIVCAHINGWTWVAVVLAGPPPRRGKRTAS